MTAKLQNPALAAALSLVLSVGMGIYLCVKAAGPVLAAVAKNRPALAAKKAAPDGFDFWTIEVDNLATDLKEERAKLSHQQDMLDQREARIQAEEKELQRVRSDIELLRKQIADHVTEVTADELKNIRTLAQAYTSLSPKAAVAILKELDEKTAVKILAQMKPDIVGAIFEEMSKESDGDVPLARRAAVLSERLRLFKSSKAPGPP